MTEMKTNYAKKIFKKKKAPETRNKINNWTLNVTLTKEDGKIKKMHHLYAIQPKFKTRKTKGMVKHRNCAVEICL